MAENTEQRQDRIRKYLKDMIRNGDSVLVVKVGGTAQNKQVEVIVASKRGQPETITTPVCTLLDKRRAGRDGNGGMRLSNWETPQDVVDAIAEALGRQTLNVKTY